MEHQTSDRLELFRNDLLRIADAFYLEKQEANGYAEAELPHDLPAVLKSFYMAVGKDRNLMHSTKIDFFSPDAFQSRLYNNTYPGIGFAKINMELYLYVRDIVNGRTKEKQDDIKTWSDSQQMFGRGARQMPPFTEFLFWTLCNAQYNMKYTITIDERKLLKQYRDVCKKEWNAEPFSTYIPWMDIDDGKVNEDILVSAEQHILIRICTWDRNKFIVSSNDGAVIEAAAQKYKSRWIRKDGKRILEEKYLCTGCSELSFAEWMQDIDTVCFGKKMNSVSEEELSAAESNLGITLPSALRLFYSIFGNKKKMLDSMYQIPKLQEITSENGRWTFAAEEQDGCRYLIDCGSSAVYRHADGETEQLDITAEELVLYLTVSQCSGFMKNICIIPRAEHMDAYLMEKSGGIGNVYYNPIVKVLGIEYNETSIMLLSNTQKAFSVFEDEYDIPIEYL